MIPKMYCIEDYWQMTTALYDIYPMRF